MTVINQAQLDAGHAAVDQLIANAKALQLLCKNAGIELCEAGNTTARDHVGLMEAEMLSAMAHLVRFRAIAGGISIPGLTVASGAK